MPVALLIELVLSLGVGLGFARDGYQRCGGWSEISWSERWNILGDGIAAGSGIVLGVGTWIASARGKGPKPWGLGRFVLTAAAAYYLTRNAHEFVREVVICWDDLSFLGHRLRQNLPDLHDSMFLVNTAHFLVAASVAYLASRVGRPTRPDAREWVGRVYGVAVVLGGFTDAAFYIDW